MGLPSREAMKAIVLILLGLTLVTFLPLRAQESLARQEQKQEGIREATARASNQLAQLVAEFDRNGIEGQDVDILKGIQSVLGRLSTDQMQKIVELLQGAQNPAESGNGKGQIIVAYTNQKAVIVQLRQVLFEYQRQLALQQIAPLLRELGDRQSSNLHEGLALLSTGRDKNTFRDFDKLSIQMQEAEQRALHDETTGILSRLASLGGRTADGLDNQATAGTKFATGRKLAESLDTATTDLKDRKLGNAATNEKTARDTLWELAALLEAEKDTMERLLEAVAELDELIAGEMDVIDQTEKLADGPRAADDPRIARQNAIAQDQNVRRAREEIKRTAAQQEAIKAREIENARKTKERSSTRISDAKERLEKERIKQQDKEKPDKNQIRNREREVERAEQELAKRIRDSERRLQDRERKNKELNQRREEALAKAIGKARERWEAANPEEIGDRLARQARIAQAELADKTDFLQRQIESIAAEPSALLKESITNMQKAYEELARDTPPANKVQHALAGEKAALAGLKAARESLLDQLENAHLVEAVPDTKMEALEKLLDKIRELKHEEKALIATLEKAEATKDPKALTAEAESQAALENQTRQAQQEASEVAPEAASDIAKAAEMMDASTEALETGKNAPDAQQAAVDALAMAEQKIEEEIAELKEAEAELAELNDLMEELNPLIEKQQDLLSDTNRESAAAKPDAQTNEELSERQDALEEETSALARKAAESSASEAAKNLSNAAQDEQKAKADLARNDPEAAQPDQSEALADLNAAKDVIEERRQELAEQLGEALPEPAADFAAAQAAIATAQDQVAEAMSQLETPISLANQLADRQEALSRSVAEQAQAAAQSPQAAPLTQAEAAALKAAEQLAQGDMQDAVAEMQKAREALGQADGQAPSPAGKATPSIPELAREQAAVQALAEQLAAANAATATEPLANASDTISPFSSESQGALPPSAQAALETAQSALAEAGAQAAANSPQPARANAEAAQNALSNAAAALALAEAGLSAPTMASAQTPAQTPAQGQQPGQAPPSPAPGNGDLGNQSGPGEGSGPRQSATGTSGFIGLPKRVRGTIRQSSSESYPAEYASQIEQYLKNLADQASGRK